MFDRIQKNFPLEDIYKYFYNNEKKWIWFVKLQDLNYYL